MKKKTIFKKRDPSWKTRRSLGHRIVSNKKKYNRKKDNGSNMYRETPA